MTIPPFSLLWAPIPCFIPPLGHMAITDSQGMIYDFGSPVHISKQLTIFGRPRRFYSFESLLN